MSRKTMPFFGKSIVARSSKQNVSSNAQTCRSRSLASPARRRPLGSIKVAKKKSKRAVQSAGGETRRSRGLTGVDTELTPEVLNVRHA